MVYSIRPKNSEELVNLFEQYPALKTKYSLVDMQHFLNFLLENFSTISTTPIAFDNKDISKPLKVARDVYNNPLLIEKRNDFKKKISFKAGNGSIKRDIKAGGGFESQLLNDFKKLQQGLKDFEFKNFMHFVVALKKQGFDPKSFSISEGEGDKNKKRPLQLDDNGHLVVGNEGEGVGDTVSDITLESNGKQFFISLKSEIKHKTVNLLHVGAKTFFGINDYFKKGDENRLNSVDDLSPNQKALLDLFDITKVDFLYNFFTKSPKAKAKLAHSKQIKDTSKYIPLLKSAFGQGFWLAHQHTPDSFKFKWFDEKSNTNYSKVDTAIVYYTGKSYIRLELENEYIKIFIQLRSSEGAGQLPGAIDVWYMYKPHSYDLAGMKENLSLIDCIRI